MNINLQGPLTVTIRVKNGCLKSSGGFIRSNSIGASEKPIAAGRSLHGSHAIIMSY
jgi:hypothetical protein